MTTPRLLVLCPPLEFDVSYAINPWMRPEEWAAHRDAWRARARAGWDALRATFEDLGARVLTVPPVPGLPDMVFTANAAVVLNRVALIARFRHAQRQGETAHFTAFFHDLVAQGHLDRVVETPPGLCLEGAGDCVFDAVRGCFWMGLGPRTDAKAADLVRAVFDCPVEALELVDPRFYHMDTALCPLPGGEVLMVEAAFRPEDRARVAQRVGAERVIPVPSEDAARFAANTVALGRDLVLNDCSPALAARLTNRGYRLHRIDLEPFTLSGGSAFCLTLALDRALALDRVRPGP